MRLTSQKSPCLVVITILRQAEGKLLSAQDNNTQIEEPAVVSTPVGIKSLSQRLSCVALVGLSIWQLACGAGTQVSKAGSPNTAGTAMANISISPGNAMVGSPDLILTISALKNFSFLSGAHKFSQLVWSQAGVDTALATAFISSSQLTAILPAPLMASPVSGTLRVEIWDAQGDVPIGTSSSVPFQVTSGTPTPAILSLSASTVTAGSPDLTITIDGANFGHYGHFTWSTAFWTTNGNLHDTGTWLQTTIVSSTQLTAVIPSALLQSPTSVQIVVMNGDVMGMSDGYFGYPRSNAVTFTVDQ